MLDKLKSVAEGIKSVLLYVVAPLAFIAGAIYYLITKNHDLEDKLKAKDGEEKLNELQGEQKQIDAGASDAISKYNEYRRAYLSANPGSLRPSVPSSKSTDSDSGSGDGAGPGYVKNADESDK